MPAPRIETPTRRDRRPRKTGPVLPFSILVALLVAFGSIYWLSVRTSVEISAANLCPETDEIPAIAAVLLDATDRVSPAERVQIRQTLNVLKERLPRFARLKLIVISSNQQEGKGEVLDLCNPGTGKDLSPLYQNPELAAKRWQERFSDVVDAALDRSLAQSPSEESRILEAIRSVSISYLADPAYRDKQRLLYVISDFLQHVPGQFTQYTTRQVGLDQFMQIQYARSVAMDLRGVDVELFYIDRPDYAAYQTAEHKRFWLDIITEFEGNVTRMKRIFGG